MSWKSVANIMEDAMRDIRNLDKFKRAFPEAAK
jgi:hypothetical protein